MTALQAVRAKCLDCTCGSMTEVRLCPSTDCALWPYRFGRRPSTLPRGSEDKKVEIARDFEAQNEK